MGRTMYIYAGATLCVFVLLGVGVFLVTNQGSLKDTSENPVESEGGSDGMILPSTPALPPVPLPPPPLTQDPEDPISPAPEPAERPNAVSYTDEGTCPVGYVDYGVPLDCITPEYFEYCKTGGMCPICLSGDTRIATPRGEVSVKNLAKGDPVWTTDYSGARVAGVVVQTSRTVVGPTHQMVQIRLSDGRELLVSPGHPTYDNRALHELVVGEYYDGGLVTEVTTESYYDGVTYDLLPSGETGFYWANGILIGSTLR